MTLLASGMDSKAHWFMWMRMSLAVLTVGPTEDRKDNFDKLRRDFEVCYEVERPEEADMHFLLYVAEILTYATFNTECQALCNLVWNATRPDVVQDIQLVFYDDMDVLENDAFAELRARDQTRQPKASWWNTGAME